MIRTGLAALAAIFVILTAGPALAERQLAIGAAGGFFVPEGAVVRPVYVWPRGTRWDPADADAGFRFREPTYTTPHGYRYVYVRGYEIIPARKPSLRKHHRAVKVSVVRVKKPRPACVTDIGNGRYDFCR
jgi:hypothetical protein